MSTKLFPQSHASTESEAILRGNKDFHAPDYVGEMHAILDVLMVVKPEELNPDTLSYLMNILSRYIPCEKQVQAMFQLEEFQANLKNL